MRHKDIFNSIISVVHLTFTPFTAVTRYIFPNKKILQVATKPEYIQEQWNTPLVESYNQQQIFRWVRNHLNLPLVQQQEYTEWDLREACERRILFKSSYSGLLG